MDAGALKEILKNIDEMILENKCFHSEVADAFDWCGLHGEKRKHEFKMCKWLKKSRNLHRLAINKLGIHIDYIELPKNDVVSYSFYNGDRIAAATENNIRTVLKDITEKWFRLEKENAEFLKDIWYELVEHKTVKSLELACFVKCLLEKVTCKIKKLERCLMKYNSVNYNSLYIISQQRKVHDRFEKKTKKAMKIG